MIRASAGAVMGALLVVTACPAERPDGYSARDAAGARETPPAVCRRTAEGEAGDLALGRCLATPELTRSDRAAVKPVVVYFDRSGSMRGFLDPYSPTRVPTDYRAVIARLV